MSKPLRKRKRIHWVVVLIGFCLLYVVYSFADQALQLSKLRHEASNLRAREATLKSDNERLSQEQQLLQTDAYVEKVAREELGLVKPGETPYILGEQKQPK
ncbi:MAG: septum formation initiator family protein [Bacillota bacterium]|nr:septum formation inhibitor [Bacillota bacterium]HWR55994.1 septum formation initiator family protein [Negativicutes bacterium]